MKDGECLRNGTDSTMETDNLRVSIYTAEGLAYRETAASSESAVLWNPVYLHDGTAEGLENYIYDLAQYAWATQDKNDDSYARNKEALAATNDEYILKTEVLDKQYYGIYAKPDALEFTTEEQEFLTKVAYGIYGQLDTNGYDSLDYTSGQIQDGIGVEMLLWDAYYGTGKYLGEIDYYSRYQVSASEAETMLKELIGREYDLASLLPDSLDLENGELGVYYTNGDIITYMALIGSEEGPGFEKLYEEDGEWKFCVAAYSFDEIDGRIELTLRPMRNSYGCQITGCHIDSYY